MKKSRLPIFAKRVKELRGEMTQGQFAEKLGISRPTVGLYESGARIPDAEVLRDIVEKCNVSADWLLGCETKVSDTPYLATAIEAVIAERRRQIEKWGANTDNSPFEWMSILGEEFGELCEAINETFFRNPTHPELGGYEKIIKEASQVAAVAVAIIESASAPYTEG